MVDVGLIVQLEARAGKEDELSAFLRSALPLVEEEPTTVVWLGIQTGPSFSRWSTPSPTRLSPDALILALKATFDPAQARDLQASVELRINDDSFRAHISERSFTVERGNASHPDVTFQTDVTPLRELIQRDRSLDDAVNSGDLTLEGDHKKAARFLRSFRSPG